MAGLTTAFVPAGGVATELPGVNSKMAEITAAMVRALRERSGLPMMDCKNALQETGGDENAAM